MSTSCLKTLSDLPVTHTPKSEILIMDYEFQHNRPKLPLQLCFLLIPSSLSTHPFWTTWFLQNVVRMVFLQTLPLLCLVTLFACIVQLSSGSLCYVMQLSGHSWHSYLTWRPLLQNHLL
jgi:hypothetical protein